MSRAAVKRKSFWISICGVYKAICVPLRPPGCVLKMVNIGTSSCVLSQWRVIGKIVIQFNLQEKSQVSWDPPHNTLIHTPSYGSALNITFLVGGHCLLKILVRANCVSHWHTDTARPRVCVLTASNHSYGLNTKQNASTNLTPGMATKASHSQLGGYNTTQLFQEA